MSRIVRTVLLWTLFVTGSIATATGRTQQRHPPHPMRRQQLPRRFERPIFSLGRHHGPQTERRSNTHAPLRYVLSLRGGGGVAATASPYGGELLELAYEWCINLGAPSALVAGVVVATLHENIHQGDLVVSPTDTRWTQFCKKVTHLLLLSAFALETISIFVTTVTATMLLSQDGPGIELATSPMRHLWQNYEVEYLTSRITFLQGLLHWLAALALNHMFPTTPPQSATPSSVTAFNQCVACSLFLVIVLMVSFYNDHMTFGYANYGSMLRRWTRLLLDTYFFVELRRRPLSVVLLPLLVSSVYWGCRALILYEEQPKSDDSCGVMNTTGPPGATDPTAKKTS